IATELATAAQVTLASRSPLRWLPQRPLGRDIHWWLTRTGLDAAPLGGWLRGHTMPILDDGQYRAALAAGNPEHRRMFRQFNSAGVTWPDGSHTDIDTVILATGYRPGL